MSKNQPSHAISGVFVFLLLGIFAVFSTVMVLLGARTYKATSERTQEHNENRVAGAYVRSMVRADDGRDALALEDFGGVQTVTMRYDYDGDLYYTRLYAYGGSLRELFTEADFEFDPEQGEPVCALEGLTAEMDGGLLTMHLTGGDEETTVHVALRCGLR